MSRHFVHTLFVSHTATSVYHCVSSHPIKMMYTVSYQAQCRDTDSIFEPHRPLYHNLYCLPLPCYESSKPFYAHADGNEAELGCRFVGSHHTILLCRRSAQARRVFHLSDSPPLASCHWKEPGSRGCVSLAHTTNCQGGLGGDNSPLTLVEVVVPGCRNSHVCRPARTTRDKLVVAATRGKAGEA